MVAVNPGDFQTAGRYMVIFFVRFLCLGPIILAGLATAVVIGWISGSLAAALAGAWLVVLGCGVGLVPLVVLAFNRFDVSMDTPT